MKSYSRLRLTRKKEPSLKSKQANNLIQQLVARVILRCHDRLSYTNPIIVVYLNLLTVASNW